MKIIACENIFRFLSSLESPPCNEQEDIEIFMQAKNNYNFQLFW